MFPDFLPQEVRLLENNESIFLAQAITRYPVVIPSASKPVETAYVKLARSLAPFGDAGSLVKSGDGFPPIVLLHGFDSSLLEFRRLIPLLAAQKTTWAVDLLGSGFTERLPDVSYNPSTIKEHLYSFYRSAIKHPVILVGASTGGATAIDFTLTYPEAVEKLVLINSVGYSGTFPIWRNFSESAVDVAVEFWRQRRTLGLFLGKKLGLLNFQTEDVIRCAALPSLMPNWSKAINDFTRSGGYYFLKERIQKVKKPTLILWGEKDDVLGTKAAYQFERAIFNSQLVWLPGLGHSPQWEQPELVANQILNFVDS